MKPEVHQDFVNAVQYLTDESCDFVIVGAHALAIHGSPRATGDLDILVRASGDNASRVVRALQRFGAPLKQHSHVDMLYSISIYRIQHNVSRAPPP